MGLGGRRNRQSEFQLHGIISWVQATLILVLVLLAQIRCSGEIISPTFLRQIFDSDLLGHRFLAIIYFSSLADRLYFCGFPIHLFRDQCFLFLFSAWFVLFYIFPRTSTITVIGIALGSTGKGRRSLTKTSFKVSIQRSDLGAKNCLGIVLLVSHGVGYDGIKIS